MFPPRSCAIQNSWNCLAHSCLLFYSFKYEAKKTWRRRETSTGTPARSRRNQQIMMEQKPFPEEREKREEGRPRRNQEEPANHEGTKAVSSKN